MTDSVESIASVFKNRISNPFTGTFIISWLTINWRVPIALIYGDKGFEDRIWYLCNEVYPGGKWVYWDRLIAGPLALAIFLPIVISRISVFIFRQLEKDDSEKRFERARNVKTEQEIEDYRESLAGLLKLDHSLLDSIGSKLGSQVEWSKGLNTKQITQRLDGMVSQQAHIVAVSQFIEHANIVASNAMNRARTLKSLGLIEEKDTADQIDWELLNKNSRSPPPSSPTDSPSTPKA